MRSMGGCRARSSWEVEFRIEKVFRLGIGQDRVCQFTLVIEDRIGWLQASTLRIRSATVIFLP
jgi:hypothetical protein